MDTIRKPPPALTRSLYPESKAISEPDSASSDHQYRLSIDSFESLHIEDFSFSSSTSLDGKPLDQRTTSIGSSETIREAPFRSSLSTTVSPRPSNSTFDVEKGLPLPGKVQSRFVRHARNTFLNVYRRLFTLVFIFNMIGLTTLLYRNSNWIGSPPLSDFATAASANIMVAILIRQDYIVNYLFKMTWLVPVTAPLRLRCMLAKIYEYGGVHSGAAVSSVVWFSLLTAFLTQQFIVGNLWDAGLINFTYVLLSLLLAIVISAYPSFRTKSHNTFENIHRWAGWFSLALFWVELILFSRTQFHPSSSSLGLILIRLPSFWFLLISSLHTIAPWFRLHKLPVQAEKLSNHAIRLHFTEPIPLFCGLRISSSPLTEWHSFACIPSRDHGHSGGSLLISSAGDWTRSLIANPHPYYWIKGLPVTGVLCMARIFRSIILVTTGSGIGPCLGVMQDIPHVKVRVIWSTPDPEHTFGKEILEMVREVDRDAVVWDTRVRGRPDLVRFAWNMWRAEGAEAVFVIGNPKITRKVVYGMRGRGVPAFGPVWDS